MDFILGKVVKILNPQKHNTMAMIRDRLTMDNPKYQDALKRGRNTHGIKRKIQAFTETEGGLEIPRGAGWVCHLCRVNGERIQFIDHRRMLKPVDFTFHGTLREYQAEAVGKALQRDSGLIHAPTGAGKTAMGLWMIAERKQPALIVVHTTELVNQWRERIVAFLGIPGDRVGVIGGGKIDLKPVTIATVQSLSKHVEGVKDHFGHVVFDECHRAPAEQYSRVARSLDARFILGLTATPERRDGLSKLIFWNIGDVVATVEKPGLVHGGAILPADVVRVDTDFTGTVDAVTEYTKAVKELVEDEARNRLICQTVASHQEPDIALVVSDRKGHCDTLAGMLRDRGLDVAVLHGGITAKQREQTVQDMRAGLSRCLVATGQLIGEGFDLAGISSVLIATPVKFRGRLIQFVGRALRPAPGKERAVVFDFVDHLNPVFMASFRTRVRAYHDQGMNIIEAPGGRGGAIFKIFLRPGTVRLPSRATAQNGTFMFGNVEQLNILNKASSFLG